MINSDLQTWNQFAAAALSKLLPEVPIPIPEQAIPAAKEHIQTITKIAAWTADLMTDQSRMRTDLQRFKRKTDEQSMTA